MNANEINAIQKNICTELCVHLTELGFTLVDYLATFDRSDFFSFSDSEAREKLYKQSYYRFMDKASRILPSVENSVARLSSALVAADEAVELEMIAMLGAKLEAFRVFEEGLKSFYDATQKALSSGNASPSLLVGEARKLKILIEDFEEKLKDA